MGDSGGLCWDHHDCPTEDCDGELQQQDKVNVVCLSCDGWWSHVAGSTTHFLVTATGEKVLEKPIAVTDGGPLPADLNHRSGEFLGELNGLVVRGPCEETGLPVLEIHGEDGMAAVECPETAVGGLTETAAEIRLAVDQQEGRALSENETMQEVAGTAVLVQTPEMTRSKWHHSVEFDGQHHRLACGDTVECDSIETVETAVVAAWQTETTGANRCSECHESILALQAETGDSGGDSP
ncbi:hypothetical protein SAMN05216226_102126 [Halovenus aranensis]|uniref:Uncharacterized protein n=1 Tax=Halovenus aranensis TaxID=890420 RepID=A0A1G8SSM2_9EURY|nr:hypothetical protein [Halovenus aranensis]SDJ32239.1 hypothetical protein SAMN05216226_102126 [Halovenus aranensis]